jgi:hypothetical protein
MRPMTRTFGRWESNIQRTNWTKKRIINKRTSLLTITRRKLSQSIMQITPNRHVFGLTINIILLLCYLSWECKNNAKYLCETGKTKMRRNIREFLQGITNREKKEIRKKIAFSIWTYQFPTGIGQASVTAEIRPNHCETMTPQNRRPRTPYT